MILFYGEGRLGNQIFQYQALSRIAKKDERIYAVGLEDIQNVLELQGPKVAILTTNGFLKRFVKYVINPLLLRPLARTLGFLNYGFETTESIRSLDGAGGELSIQKGLLRQLTFVDGGHYQNASLWTTLFPAPLFRVIPQLRSAARQFLESECKNQGRPAFVHVRRGDYKTFNTHGLSDLVLPPEFYFDAIRELETRVGRKHLVFVTDDPAWVAESFRDVKSKSVASFTPAMDFAIMTECGSGILSNSTFSLAAAFLLNSPEVVIGPCFWIGFRVGEWIPPRIKVENDRVLYLPVLSNSLSS